MLLVCVDNLRNVLRKNSRMAIFARRIDRFQHPLRADDAVRLMQYALHADGAAFRIAHSDTDQRNLLGERHKGEFFFQQFSQFLKFPAFNLLRSADDDRLCSDLLRCTDLICITACAAGIFGDNIFGICRPEHSGIQFFIKRPLHGDDAFPCNSTFGADIQRTLHRQHTRINPFTQGFVPTEQRQIFASGGQEHIALRVFQIFDAGRNIADPHAVRILRTTFALQAEILGIRLFTGTADVFRSQISIRMGRIHDQFKLPCSKEIHHLFCIHASDMNGYRLKSFHQIAAVFGCRAGRNLNAASLKQLNSEGTVKNLCEYYASYGMSYDNWILK